VPIVPAAVLFDLAIGRAEVRPDAAMGYAACDAAASESQQQARAAGTVGAGTGATVGNILGPTARMKGGLGLSVIQITDKILVGALMVVNCFGDVVDPASEQILAGVRKLPEGGFADTMQLLPQMTEGVTGPGNTVIGVAATNASLSKEAANKVAQMAHDGLARAIKPAHTMFDGDTIFSLSTGQESPADVNLIGAFAAEAVAQAIVNAVQRASPLAGVPALSEWDSSTG
jgi:L-aminopeptidase/D-esterase-like protein